MRTNARTLRPILVVMLCGAVLAVSDISAPSPAAAFGFGFGGMGGGFGGGFGGGARGGGMRSYGGGTRGYAMTPRRGIGTSVDRPSGWSRGTAGG